ncbi:hypothetical protein SCALM49S_09619 [Streptomyces californicus]
MAGQRRQRRQRTGPDGQGEDQIGALVRAAFRVADGDGRARHLVGGVVVEGHAQEAHRPSRAVARIGPRRALVGHRRAGSAATGPAGTANGAARPRKTVTGSAPGRPSSTRICGVPAVASSSWRPSSRNPRPSS